MNLIVLVVIDKTKCNLKDMFVMAKDTYCLLHLPLGEIPCPYQGVKNIDPG